MLTVLANIIVWDDHATPAAKAVQEWPRPQPAPRRLCNPRHAPARPPYAPPRRPRHAPQKWQRPCHCWASHTFHAHPHPLHTAGRARLPCRLPVLCDRLPSRAAAARRARARAGEHSRHQPPSYGLRASPALPPPALQRLALRHTPRLHSPLAPESSPPGHLPPTFPAPPPTSSQGTALLGAAVRARLSASSHTLHQPHAPSHPHPRSSTASTLGARRPTRRVVIKLAGRGPRPRRSCAAHARVSLARRVVRPWLLGYHPPSASRL